MTVIVVRDIALNVSLSPKSSLQSCRYESESSDTQPAATQSAKLVTDKRVIQEVAKTMPFLPQVMSCSSIRAHANHMLLTFGFLSSWASQQLWNKCRSVQWDHYFLKSALAPIHGERFPTTLESNNRNRNIFRFRLLSSQLSLPHTLHSGL